MQLARQPTLKSLFLLTAVVSLAFAVTSQSEALQGTARIPEFVIGMCLVWSVPLLLSLLIRSRRMIASAAFVIFGTYGIVYAIWLMPAQPRYAVAAWASMILPGVPFVDWLRQQQILAEPHDWPTIVAALALNAVPYALVGPLFTWTCHEEPR